MHLYHCTCLILFYYSTLLTCTCTCMRIFPSVSNVHVCVCVCVCVCPCAVHSKTLYYHECIATQESQIKRIFGTMIGQKLQDFEEEVKALGDVMTQVTPHFAMSLDVPSMNPLSPRLL